MRAERRLPRRPDLWIVLPVSGLAKGKSRLAPVLSPGERERLNRGLVLHGVQTATGARVAADRCIVVSPCQRTLRIARAAGAIGLAEPRPGRGLNAAIRWAVRHAVRHGARRVLVLPADLPLASAPLLSRLVALAVPAVHSIVVPDRERVGTNALLFTARPNTAPQFGIDSFAKHCRSARESGRVPIVFDVPELRQDLDTPEHLAQWRAAGAVWGR